MNNLLDVAVHERVNMPPTNETDLPQYSVEEHHQAFCRRSQSIKMRNPNRAQPNHRRRTGSRKSNLAHQRRPSMYSKPSKTKNEEKESEVRDYRDHPERDNDNSGSYNLRRERQILLQALESAVAADEEQEETEEAKSNERRNHRKDTVRRGRKPSVPKKSTSNPPRRRARSMDPGLVRGRGGQDEGEDQPNQSNSNSNALRRTHSLDAQKSSTRRKKKRKVPKVSSISSCCSVDTFMMERDIWIECLWFNKKRYSGRHKKKTYFKSFRTQKCVKRPPEGAQTVLYLEHFLDSDEDWYSSSTCGSSDEYSDCGDSMECLYKEEYCAEKECSSMCIPAEIMPVLMSCKKRSKKKPRRIRKRWRAFIRLVKPSRASF